MLGNISWPQLLILLVIVVLIFGTKRLSGLGKDLGGAIRSFKGAMKEEENKPADEEKETNEKLETKEQDADFAENQKTEAKETDKS
jgi:sec-independent protein translocase protein TatA